MSNYVERNLNNGEEIIFKAKKSIWALVPSILWFIICLIAAIILQSNVFSKIDNSDIIVMFVWIFLVGLWGGIPLIKTFCNWFSIALCITNKRVIGKKGVLSIHTMDYMISKVDNICIEAGIIGNIFKYHTVIVRGGGEIEDRHKNKNKFIGISNAREFKNILTEAIEQHAANARKDQAMEIAQAMAQKEHAESLARAEAAKETARIIQDNNKGE